MNLSTIFPNLAVFFAVAVLLLVLTGFLVFRLVREAGKKGSEETRLRDIIDSMPMVSCIIDRDFRVLECNEEAPRMFGLSSRQEYIKKFFDLFPPRQPDGRESLEKATEMNEIAFAAGRNRFEWMFVHADGEPVPCEMTLVRTEWKGKGRLLVFMKDVRKLHTAQSENRLLMQRMQAMLDSSPMACVIFDENSNILEANKEVENLFRISDRQIFIDRFFDFSPKCQPDGTLSREKILAQIKKVLQTGRSRFWWMFRTLDGKPIPSEEIMERVSLDGQDWVIAYTRDLRDVVKYRATERTARQRLQAILNSSPLACAIFDKDFMPLDANREMLKVLGLRDRLEYINNIMDFSPKCQPDGTLSSMKVKKMIDMAVKNGRAHYEWMCLATDGKLIPCEMTLVLITIDGEHLLIGYMRDLRQINKAVSMVKRLEVLAFTDPLTGASNRRHFDDVVQQELQTCIDKNLDFTVIMFDIDFFKKVNDTYGHDVGDGVLKIVVARTSNSLKKDTLVARYGGEEFLVSLPGVSNEVAVRIAEQIRSRIKDRPFAIGGKEMNVTVSLGVASKSGDCNVLQDIVKRADKALYHAKETGRNKVVSYGSMSS